MAQYNAIIKILGDSKGLKLKEHFDKFKESWNKFRYENKDFVNESTDDVDNFIKIYSLFFESKKKNDKDEQEKSNLEKEQQEKSKREKEEKEKAEKEKANQESNEVSFRVKVGKIESLELMRNSVPGNKYAFYNNLETCISFFLGGESLEKGNYLVLNKNNDSYSKLDISPKAETMYNNLLNRITKNSEPDKIFKNIFTFLNNTYKKFQNKHPNEIELLLTNEIESLPT